jgi:predicted Zn-dependent peptidase
VDRDRCAVDVGSYVHDGFDPGLFILRVTVSPDSTPAGAEAAVLDELSRIARQGVSEEELSKARNVLLAAHWRRLKTIDGKAEALGVEDVIGGDYHRVFSTAERYRRVTRKQIQTLAARTFDERNRTVGVLLPTEEAP